MVNSVAPTRPRTPRLSTALLGSLFLLVACNNEDKPPAQEAIPAVEALCTDGFDNDQDGQADCDDTDCQSPGGDCKPAPVLDRTVASTLSESAAFLYQGKHPLQKDADADAFEAKRIAIVKGRVLDEAGEPLAGVRVSVTGHKEYGYTFTRSDGYYDLVVNGGSRLLLDFAVQGHLPAQRAVIPGWQRHHYLGEVGLVASNGESTKVTVEADRSQAISGPSISDTYGEREPLVVFQPGTVAEAVLSDGSSSPLSSLTVTVTEYPLDGAQQYLPGTPQVTGLSYGLDFSVAEAKKLGASHVQFSEPVSIYVENFLELPVGTVLPLGYYDGAKGQWEQGQPGHVIVVLEIVDGKAIVDANGDGKADALTELEALGITESDLQRLAIRYEVGSQLMQGKVSHFSAYAAQITVKAPKGAVAPNSSSLQTVIDKPTRRGHLLVEPRAVVNSLPVTGTPYSLTYQSNRTTAYEAGLSLELPLIPAKVPTGLKRVTARVAIAGKLYEASFAAKGNQSFPVVWDGLDGFGRLLQGPQRAEIYVAYVYDGVLPNGTKPTKPIEVTLGQKFELTIGLWDFKGFEVGGFGLNVLHAYDPALRTLFYGNGNQRSADNVALVTKPASNDAGFVLGTPDSLVVMPDGSLLVTDDQQYDNNALGRVLRFAPDGTPSVAFGPGASGSAGEVALGQPQGILALDDGSLVVADVMEGAIRRIEPDGKVTTLVSSSADDDPEAVYEFANLDGIAMGPRQELYIVDADRVLKLEAGELTVFAGGGTATTDGGLATEAVLANPSGVVVSPQGLVYIAERDGNRIRKIQADGSIVTVAGTGTTGFSGDGGKASEAMLAGPRGLALAPDGSLYLVDQGNGRIRRVTPDGLIQTAIGGGENEIVDGLLATHVGLDEPDGIAIGPDGTLYIATMSSILRVAPGLPEMSEKDNLIASDDGRTLYRFDYRGKHLETIDAMTGATELEFGYNAQGFLDSITDESGLETLVERTSDNRPKAIVGPYGQTTKLELTADGWFAKLTDPIERSYELTWNEKTGLLDKIQDPTKKVGTYQFDPMGLIETVTDPTGYQEKLAPLTTNAGSTGVKVTTKGGKVTEYLHQPVPTGGLIQSVKAPDSTQVEWTEVPTSRSSKSPDGTKILTYVVPDQNFGPQSMLPSESTVTLPSGKELTTSYQRTKAVTDISNALTLEDWQDDATVNGRLYSSTYSRRGRTVITKSPMGRTATTTLDELGRPVQVRALGMPVVALTYDEDGRLATVTKTADGQTRAEVRVYGADGWISSIKNPAGNEVAYDWDEVGRPRTQTRPDSQVIAWSFDNADNVTSLTPPGRNAHRFDYDGTTQLLSWATPPNVTQTAVNGFSAGQKSYAYGADHELTAINYSDGRKVGFSYTNGQLKTQKLANATLTYAFAKGLLTSVNRSDSVKVELTYDGALPTGSTWSGAVSGSVKATYDSNFWLQSLTVNNASTVRFAYDDDGLLIGASSPGGAMSFARDADTGKVIGTSLGNVSTVNRYSGFGELAELSASASGANLLGQTIQRDDLGRVKSITESNGTSTHELSYEYDNLGRIARATRDGVVTQYAYDANGNRISVQTGRDAAVAATYDAQDRILTYGTQTYVHSPAGNLESRTDGTKTLGLTYDELGNLTKAILTEGTPTKTIDYVIDGFGRRVGRKVNGAFDRSWLYRDGLRPVAEVDSAGTFTHFVYADSQSGAPDFLIRSGVLYRVVKDHLGSVRLVVNATTGVIAQSLEYDAYGRILSETGAGFQPFGFAGGLYDADTKLVRFGARDYDPGMGRWTNKDPIGFAGGDTNVYAYVGGDPVNRVDPRGLDPNDGSGGSSGTGNGGSDGTSGTGRSLPQPLVRAGVKDWCGSGWSELLVPDSLAGVNWAAACKAHDECYEMCESTQSQCDSALGRDVTNLCLQQSANMSVSIDAYGALYFSGQLGAPLPCEVIGSTFRAAVTRFGGNPYANAQTKHQCQ